MAGAPPIDVAAMQAQLQQMMAAITTLAQSQAAAQATAAQAVVAPRVREPDVKDPDVFNGN